MHTKLIISITLGIFLCVLGYAYYTRTPSPVAEAPAADSSESAASAGGNAPGTENSSPALSPSGYTMAEVAKHAGASSCWTAIHGKVYDLTRYINQHPGGPETVLSLCGTDGSAAFDAQHGGQRRPANELAGLLIGPLTQ